MGDPQLRWQRLRSHDGTELSYYSAGRPDGPTLVLCNGLGGNGVVWRSLVRHFAPRFRILGWDYRGLFASGPAARADHYGFSHHVGDLQALLEETGAEAPVLLGWSMGVQLAIELQRTRPELASAMVAICGTPGRPLATAFDSSLSEPVLRGVLGLMGRLGRGLSRAAPLARSRSVAGGFVSGARRLGWMSPQLDLEAFQELAEEWLRLDLGIYAEIFRHLAEHDASDLLASLAAPTLVIAGERDRFTPARLAQRMVDEIPDAELCLLPGATHFSLLEYPREIAAAIEEFLDRRSLGP